MVTLHYLLLVNSRIQEENVLQYEYMKNGINKLGQIKIMLLNFEHVQRIEYSSKND